MERLIASPGEALVADEQCHGGADNNENEENRKSGSGASSKPNTSAKESLNDRVSNLLRQ